MYSHSGTIRFRKGNVTNILGKACGLDLGTSDVAEGRRCGTRCCESSPRTLLERISVVGFIARTTPKERCCLLVRSKRAPRTLRLVNFPTKSFLRGILQLSRESVFRTTIDTFSQRRTHLSRTFQVSAAIRAFSSGTNIALFPKLPSLP